MSRTAIMPDADIVVLSDMWGKISRELKVYTSYAVMWYMLAVIYQLICNH